MKLTVFILYYSDQQYSNERLARVKKCIENQTLSNIKIETANVSSSNLATILNEAVKKCKTEYISFIRFDSTLEENCFELLLKTIEKKIADIVLPKWATGNEYNIASVYSGEPQFFVQLPFPESATSNFLSRSDLLLKACTPSLGILPAVFRVSALKSNSGAEKTEKDEPFDIKYNEFSFYKKLLDLSKTKPIPLVGSVALVTHRTLKPNSVLPIPQIETAKDKLRESYYAFKRFAYSIYKLFQSTNQTNTNLKPNTNSTSKIASSNTDTLKNKKIIKLYEAAKDKNYEENNFGDILTSALIEKHFGKKVFHTPPLFADMAGAGSMLERLICQKDDNKPFIWGSGFILNDISELDYNDAKIRLVRGKLTLGRIANIPDGEKIALGDPGLLVDKLVPKPKNLKTKLGIIPHASEMDLPIVKLLSKVDGIQIINPVGKVEIVLQKIANCKYILSSSLHGLIAADSYSIPNLHIALSDKLHGGLYKFEDYYSVFTEKRFFGLSFENVLDKSAEQIANLIEKKYKKPKNLEQIKSDIEKSFPL